MCCVYLKSIQYARCPIALENDIDVAMETASFWLPNLPVDFRTTVTLRFTLEFCLLVSRSIRTGYESTTFHGEFYSFMHDTYHVIFNMM